MFLVQERTRYKNKNAYIGKINGTPVFISYNTIITAYAAGALFVSENQYSITTGHHISDARRYFNAVQEIEVTPETLYKIVEEGPETAHEVIKDFHDFQEVSAYIKEGRPLYPLNKQSYTVEKISTSTRKFKKSFRDYYKFKVTSKAGYFKAAFKRTIYYKQVKNAGTVKQGQHQAGTSYHAYKSKVINLY